jgi:hypothetical protein
MNLLALSFLHFSGLLGTRALYAPSLNRETLEYLYVAHVRVTPYDDKEQGVAVQATFDSFDTRRYLKGFASTGSGTVAAEPIFNFNRLFVDGYVKRGGKRVAAQAGVIPIELPTLQLPLNLGQVGTVAGARAEFDDSEHWAAGALGGNLRLDQTQSVPYKIEGLRERWNWVNAWLDHRGALGRTRASAYGWNPRVKDIRGPDLSYALTHEKALLDGRLTPRAYALYYPDLDRFSELAFSVEGTLFGGKLKARPGWLYYSRDVRITHHPNSNLFAPGVDLHNLFLVVESPLPRAGDSLYAAVTTGAKRFMAQRGTRFEAGVFLRFASVPGLP